MCVKQCLLIKFKAKARSFSKYKFIDWGSASRTLGVLSRMMTHHCKSMAERMACSRRLIQLNFSSSDSTEQ